MDPEANERNATQKRNESDPEFREHKGPEFITPGLVEIKPVIWF
jgi:hypothetical protein